MQNLSSQMILCIRDCGEFFVKGRKYYCFADEGYDFWISAPFLVEKLGVSQIKCGGKHRDRFAISW